MAHDSYLTYGKREGQQDFPTHLISGIPSYLKSEIVPPVTEKLEERKVKAAVLGLPWEHTNTYGAAPNCEQRLKELANQ